MRNNLIRQASIAGLLVVIFATPLVGFADGMIPETTVIIVEEAKGEASVKVTNTDAYSALLHVKVVDVPEDTEPLLLVTPQLAKVEPGKQQLVRFILTNQQPLNTQRLKRVVFEGIPQSRGEGSNQSRVGVSIAQNLPVILHPKGLERNPAPWKGLSWSIKGNQLYLRNNTKYVVRLAQSVTLLPSSANVALSRGYVLPGDALSFPIPVGAAASNAVRLQPATVYGFAVEPYEVSLVTESLGE
jgi:P pilus assembly chaperone PapD